MSRESHHDTLLKVQRTLTAWVDAVARPADETRLFQQACDLAVGSGLSRMASFGYASESPRRIGELPAETQIALLYHSPGNIRELQNVMERSVIVSEGEALSVDESWLSGKPRAPESNSQTELSHRLAAQEKEMIEAALRECGGRVSGPAGAAARRDSRIYSRIEDQRR